MPLSVFAAAREAGEHPAVVTGQGTLSYAELAAWVARRIATLRARSLAGSAPVGIVAATDLATFETIHALIALGTPVFPIHPRLTPPERESLVAGVAPAAVLDPARLSDSSATGAPEARATASGGDASSGERRPGDPAVPPSDERPLAIVHTSGTTGQPRGVVLSRRAFAASARASASNLGWRADDRWLVPLPLAHVGGLSILTRCLLARRTVVLAPGTGADALVESIRRHRVTLLSVVPTVLKRVLDLDGASPPDHLRAVLVGGAPASGDLLRRAADRGWPVLATYGLTEACSQVATQRYGARTAPDGGCGPSLPGIDLRIGPDGAILLRGATLFSGYVPAAHEPPRPPGGWFDTGDRGRLDEHGNLHVLGRRSDRIVTGGENVDPAEVERVLEALAGVAEACVFGIPDEDWGEVVCAALVLEPGVRDSPQALAESVRALGDRLAPFKRPRRVAVLDALPRNATGKVDRPRVAHLSTPRLRSL